MNATTRAAVRGILVTIYHAAQTGLALLQEDDAATPADVLERVRQGSPRPTDVAFGDTPPKGGNGG